MKEFAGQGIKIETTDQTVSITYNDKKLKDISRNDGLVVT